MHKYTLQTFIFILGMFVISLLFWSCSPTSPDTLKDISPAEETDAIAEEGELLVHDSMPTNELVDLSVKNGNTLAGTTTPYLIFTQSAYDQAISQNKTVLLNFYANWCPECKKEQPEAIAAFAAENNPDLIGFRVNYKDDETDLDEKELAKIYGITSQHTKVIIKNGKRVLKSPESWNKERYLSEFAKI